MPLPAVVLDGGQGVLLFDALGLGLLPGEKLLGQNLGNGLLHFRTDQFGLGHVLDVGHGLEDGCQVQGHFISPGSPR